MRCFAGQQVFRVLAHLLHHWFNELQRMTCMSLHCWRLQVFAHRTPLHGLHLPTKGNAATEFHGWGSKKGTLHSTNAIPLTYHRKVYCSAAMTTWPHRLTKMDMFLMPYLLPLILTCMPGCRASITRLVTVSWTRHPRQTVFLKATR